MFVFIHFSRDLTFYYVCALKLEGEKKFFLPLRRWDCFLLFPILVLSVCVGCVTNGALSRGGIFVENFSAVVEIFDIR